ncbi:hypothetical protein FDW96_07920 [Citrobacter sp. TBCS-15]|nr:hypothetical protein FDW96_07920 [Citrobacter sp. TBCS-15]TKU45946.1 hypothetical protein FDX11_14895 [Citrobacter sp. wls714]TKU69358.1 hypothetical protein FDX14_21965 [Citrobacter sp. wls710]TKU76253.1 hypothetical protein FDW92_10295 [Citrobacter sp. wls706]TKV09620.1 hypothetical protein FDX04_23580 [Citrobacter sp. wls615]
MIYTVVVTNTGNQDET